MTSVGEAEVLERRAAAPGALQGLQLKHGAGASKGSRRLHGGRSAGSDQAQR